MNLVTNASEAIEDRDGMIRVTTSRSKVAGDYLQLEVTDTGRGMSPETQARVFDPFFTTKSAGHGLGLAIVQGIVRSLGGAIQLRSELGKGTTFQILLPCAAGVPVETGAHASSGNVAPPSVSATLLVVEDEEALREAVAKMLRKSGFVVFDVADGAAAIDLLHANGSTIDAILLDLTIPGASSQEIVAEAVKRRPETKVILTSAYSQEMTTGSMKAPQIRGFVRKPFQLGDLVKTLRSVLD
jgi:CheY-like chemotaxis protein